MKVLERGLVSLSIVSEYILKDYQDSVNSLTFLVIFCKVELNLVRIALKVWRIKLNNRGSLLQITWKGNGKKREIASVVISSNTVEEKNIFGTIPRDFVSKFAELGAGENCLIIIGRGGPGYNFSFPVDVKDIQALKIFLKKPLTIKGNKDKLKISKVMLGNSSPFKIPRHCFPRLCLSGYSVLRASGLFYRE